MVWAAVAVALGVIVGLAAWQFANRGTAPQEEAAHEVVGGVEPTSYIDRPGTRILTEPSGELLDRQVLERSGRELATHDLLDRFLVVDFIFTSCSGTCPRMTEKMAALQERVRDAGDVRLVSFTTDPKRDSLDVLTRFADEWKADPDLWYFLFTNRGNVLQIAHDGMKLGHPSEPMAHSDRFALVDRKGRVRAYYEPLGDPEWEDRLLGDLEWLRQEPESRRPE